MTNSARRSAGLAALILASAFGGVALAQAPADLIPRAEAQPSPSTRTAPIRFNIAFRVPLVAPDAAVDIDAAAIESGRKSVYEQASRECESIIATFKEVDCTLSSLSVMVVPALPNNRQQAAVTGTAVYFVRPR